MKFINFAGLAYPKFPADFAERHRSVWVDVDRTLFDPAEEHELYNQALDMLEFSDAMGFDGVGVNEHHANGYGMNASPNLLAAALARSTRNAAILIAGNSIALYNPPMRVAEELAMIDAISGGRVIAGFPVGTPMDTAFVYGLNPASIRDRYLEALELIKRAWTATEPFSFNGHYNKFRYVNTLPRPVQQPHPPVWVPGGGSVDTWEWCAEQGLPYLYLGAFGSRLAQRNLDAFWASVAEAGHDPNPYRIGFYQAVAVADSEAEARELYREPIEYHYNMNTVYDGFSDPPGYKPPKSVRQSVQARVERAIRDAADGRDGAKPFYKRGVTYEEAVEKGYVIVGSPTQVAEKLHKVVTSLNAGHLIFQLRPGNASRELTRHNITLMATKVMPELKSLFEDEWEDHWWPRPALAAERVTPDPTFGDLDDPSPLIDSRLSVSP